MKDEKDLIYEIQNVLHAHEDAYMPGAWEDFVKKKKRRRVIVYIRMVAAAVILLFLGYATSLFVPSTPLDPNNQQTTIIKKTPHIYPENNRRNDSTDKAVVISKNNSSHRSTATPLTATKPPVNTEPLLSRNVGEDALPLNNKTDEIKSPAGVTDIAEAVIPRKDATAVATSKQPSNVSIASFAAPANGVSPIVNTDPKRYERSAQRLNYDSLANVNKPKPLAADEKKTKNLSYALMVSPSVGNQKMNFGTGVEVAYNINKNFSVSSGIAYAYVNAGSNRITTLDATPNRSLQGYTASASASNSFSFDAPRSSQSVKGVKLALSGLEIPLSFQYKTKGGFFLNAGVSAMSVIGNDLSYNYINNRAVSTLSNNGLANTISVITEESTEKSGEKVAGYVGFYTLSAGKKISFGRGKLNFAPFIKIPFNRVSSENIQLIHGGVQLGFGF